MFVSQIMANQFIHFLLDVGIKMWKYSKNEIDWKKREEMLFEILKKYRKNNGEYDCIVPSSGGKDSSFTAHILKYK